MERNRALMIVPGRRQARRERWARIVADWKDSGLSGVAFAADRGIDLRSLYRWGRQARQRALTAGRPGLIELPPVTMSEWAAEVATRSGAVRLAPTASPRWAGELIRELSRC